MADCHHGAFLALACGQAAKASGQGGGCGVRSGPCRLAETAPQPGAALAGLIQEPFSRAFMGSGTDPCPTGSVLGGGKLVHIRSNLGEEIGGRPLLDPRNGNAQGDSLLVRLDVLVDLRVNLGAWCFQASSWS